MINGFKFFILANTLKHLAFANTQKSCNHVIIIKNTETSDTDILFFYLFEKYF